MISPVVFIIILCVNVITCGSSRNFVIAGSPSPHITWDRKDLNSSQVWLLWSKTLENLNKLLAQKYLWTAKYKLTGVSSQKQSCTPLHSSTWWWNAKLIFWGEKSKFLADEAKIFQDSPPCIQSRLHHLGLGDVLLPHGKHRLLQHHAQDDGDGDHCHHHHHCQQSTANCQTPSRWPVLDKLPSWNPSFVENRCCYCAFSSAGREDKIKPKFIYAFHFAPIFNRWENGSMNNITLSSSTPTPLFFVFQ